MTIRFPLPYSSLSSLYRGLVGKSCDWIYPKNALIKYNHQFDFPALTWDVRQTGLILPYFSEYEEETEQLYLNLHLLVSHKEKKVPIEYNEKIHIQHVMKDVYHLSIHSERIENKENVKMLLNEKYKWLVSGDIHHLFIFK